MRKDVKTILKENKAKVIGGAAIVGGIAIGYALGSHHLIKMFEGKHCLLVIDTDKNWIKRMMNFLNINDGKNVDMAYLFKTNVAKDGFADRIAKAVSKLPDGYNSLNVYMEAVKK